MSVAVAPEPQVDQEQRVQHYRFTSEQYMRMGSLGILSEGEKVELIKGEVLRMSPIGLSHRAVVYRLNRLLMSLAKDQNRAFVTNKGALEAAGPSIPEPDCMVLKYRDNAYSDRHPNRDEIYLLIEVADTSLRFDREVKAPLYAAAGIRDYWIVNIPDGCIEVFRDPKGDAYQSKQIHKRGDAISPLMDPDHKLDPADILGPV